MPDKIRDGKLRSDRLRDYSRSERKAIMNEIRKRYKSFANATDETITKACNQLGVRFMLGHVDM